MRLRIFRELLVFAMVAASPVSADTALELPVRPNVRFAVTRECETALPSDALLLAANLSGVERDQLVAVIPSARVAQFFELDGTGCFSMAAETKLPWRPTFAATRRAAGGQDAIYLYSSETDQLLRWDRSTGEFIAQSAPPALGEVVWMGVPDDRSAAPAAEIGALYQNGKFSYAVEVDGLKWRTLELGSYLKLHSPIWEAHRLLFVGATDRLASHIHSVDLSAAAPAVQSLKSVSFLDPSVLQLIPRSKLTPLLWSKIDSSFWEFSAGESGGALRPVGQLPDLLNWRPIVRGDFLARGNEQLLAIPAHSSSWWLFGDQVELAATPVAVSEITPLVVGAFEHNGRDELVVLAPNLQRLRAMAVAEPVVRSHAPLRCEGTRFLPGVQGRWSEACPPGHAVVGVDDSTYIGVRSYFTVDCCPMPSDDVLAEQLPDLYERCPEGSVVTSGPLFSEAHKLRCTKLSPRYKLGLPRPGVYWGEGLSVPRTRGGIERKAIPESLRTGIGRESRTSWDLDGCIGDPPGSLLTEVVGGDCPTTRFRELLYSGAPGDPPAGTPVPFYPPTAQR